MYRRWSASIWQFCRCFQSPSTGHPVSTRGNISSPCGASFSWRELWADTSGDPPWNEIIELSIFRVFLSFVSRSSDRVTRLFHFTAQVSPAKQLINKDHVDCELRFTLVHPQLSISTVENLKRRSEISIRKKKKRKKKISKRRFVENVYLNYFVANYSEKILFFISRVSFIYLDPQTSKATEKKKLERSTTIQLARKEWHPP